MKVRCSNIQWDTSDTEGKLPKLPKTVTFTVPDLQENEDQEVLTEELGEMLSNKTGFCVLGFCHQIVG